MVILGSVLLSWSSSAQTCPGLEEHRLLLVLWTVLYVEFANIQCFQERLRPVTGTVN